MSLGLTSQSPPLNLGEVSLSEMHLLLVTRDVDKAGHVEAKVTEAKPQV